MAALFLENATALFRVTTGIPEFLPVEKWAKMSGTGLPFRRTCHFWTTFITCHRGHNPMFPRIICWKHCDNRKQCSRHCSCYNIERTLREHWEKEITLRKHAGNMQCHASSPMFSLCFLHVFLCNTASTFSQFTAMLSRCCLRKYRKMPPVWSVESWWSLQLSNIWPINVFVDTC